MTEDPITFGTQAEAVRALEFYHELLRKRGYDQDRWCYEHQRSQIKYIDGVLACPDCEADDVIYRVHPTSPHEGSI